MERDRDRQSAGYWPRDLNMFTGIVEETGIVQYLQRTSAGARLVVTAREVLDDLETGDSIAVNGCCLTVIEFDENLSLPIGLGGSGGCVLHTKVDMDLLFDTNSFLCQNSFTAELSPETLEKTNLDCLQGGSLVNLERPLLPTNRLSGHFVLGHVDGTGEVVALDPAGDDNWWLEIRVPEQLQKLLVYKGSIAIDGISLTIASLDWDTLKIAVIPHTYKQTTIARLSPGSLVNLECDMLAKHVERLLSAQGEQSASLLAENQQEQG